MKYTKGKWKLIGDRAEDCIGIDIVSVFAYKMIPVARIPYKEWENSEANAHLIAAAPEMYEALKNTTEALCDACKHTVEIAQSEGLRAYPCEGDCEIILQAKRALAKVEGK